MPPSDDPVKRARQLANLNPRARAAPRGNRRAVRHGAYAQVAEERAAAKVLAVFDALGEDAPLREAGELPAADGARVYVCAEAMCRLEDVSAYLRDHGLVDPKTGGLRTAAVEVEAKLRREVGDHLDALGMSPRSRARLGVDIRMATVDVSSALSEPDPAIRAQLLRRAGLIDDGQEASDG